MIRVLGVFLALFVCTPVWAMQPIEKANEFNQIVDGKTLLLRLYRIRLNVKLDGSITGRALGRNVTGDWFWQDGFFCRTMYWGQREIAYNCQLVEYDGSNIRFTTDRGKGNSASFVITK